MCVGFGEQYGKCRTYHDGRKSPYWCDPCEVARRKHIGAQLDALLAAAQTPTHEARHG